MVARIGLRDAMVLIALAALALIAVVEMRRATALEGQVRRQATQNVQLINQLHAANQHYGKEIRRRDRAIAELKGRAAPAPTGPESPAGAR